MKAQDANNWDEWELAEADNLKEISRLQEEGGHSHHCACRIVWGDGECECDLYEHGYNPYAWMKGRPLKEIFKDIDQAVKKAKNGKR